LARGVSGLDGSKPLSLDEGSRRGPTRVRVRAVSHRVRRRLRGGFRAANFADDVGDGPGGSRAGVLDERAIQVEEKLKLTKLKKVKEAEARVELETELERINALEDAKVAEGKHVLLQHRDLLKNQIDQKRFEGAASQFNKKQEKMMAERAEAQYQAMLDDQMFKVKSQMEKFSKKY